MGSWFEDADIVTFASGTPANHVDWFQKVNAHGRAAFKARWIDVPFDFDTSATYECGWIPDYQPTGAVGWYVLRASAINVRMRGNLPLRAGEVITDFDIIHTDPGDNGGEMALYRAQMPTVGGSGVSGLTAATKLDDIGSSSNPWNVAGVTDGYFYRVQTSLSTPRTIEEGYVYFVSIQAPPSISTGLALLASCKVKAQFGSAPP